MTCVAPAKKDFWLSLRGIDNNERGGILGFYARMEADTLSVNEVTRDRCHS